MCCSDSIVVISDLIFIYRVIFHRRRIKKKKNIGVIIPGKWSSVSGDFHENWWFPWKPAVFMIFIAVFTVFTVFIAVFTVFIVVFIAVFIVASMVFITVFMFLGQFCFEIFTNHQQLYFLCVPIGGFRLWKLAVFIKITDFHLKTANFQWKL